MPREAANRFASTLSALQWDRGRWIWLLLILLLLAAVLALGDNISAVLRYDRSAIAAGGWWRLLTAHIVHLNTSHLILNELGLVLMWSLFAQDFDPVEWCAIVLSGALPSVAAFGGSVPMSPGTSVRPECCTR
jgi:membrane associated rhomboid family serine protease